MSLFKRLFSSNYRDAVAAEAAGDFLAAARAYALCGDKGKVADMHLAQARVEQTLEGRIRELRVALELAQGVDQRREMILRLLGGALREQAEELGLATARGARRMRDAAQVLEQAGSWQAAGDCHLSLGERQLAATAYSQAGMVERVEQVLGQEEQQRSEELQQDSSFSEYELLLQAGQRGEAAEALRRCVELAQAKGDYRRLLADLERRMLSTGRIILRVGQQRLLLLGQYPVILGRDVDCDLQVRGHSVSRHHARVLDSDQGLMLEDARSRNGTLLGGLPLESSVQLPETGTIGLGSGASLAFEVLDAAGPTLRLQVSEGLDQDKTAVVSVSPVALDQVMAGAPALVFAFSRGRPVVNAQAGAVLLNGARISGSAQLIRGDELELDGQRVVVDENQV